MNETDTNPILLDLANGRITPAEVVSELIQIATELSCHMTDDVFRHWLNEHPLVGRALS